MIDIDITKKIHGSDGNMCLKVDISIQKNEFLAISGKSGSGKTTLLRILAGLEEADGKIVVDGKIWLDNSYSLAIQKRELGFVFQDYALFPNMNVEENLLFVKKDKTLVKELLEITELSPLAKRYPQTLSGGQKQRVSLCRAMMNRPKLLLLDEPLSALDPKMRLKLQNEILTLHKKFDTTTIMISHDPSEIYKLSSRTIILDDATIVNDGLAQDILFKKNSSENFLFEAKILNIQKKDIIYLVTISFNKELLELMVTAKEIEKFQIGDIVNINSKIFSLTIDKK